MSSQVSPLPEMGARKSLGGFAVEAHNSAQPTKKELKQMSQEEAEEWMARYMADQREMLANFDVDKIERDPLAGDSAGASLTWKNVSFSIQIPDPDNPKAKLDKVLLEENNGHITAGSLVAMMGPSGCGKSTLLDILAGKKTTPYQGDVFLNGHAMKGDPMVSRCIAYVGQEDVMPQHWKTREAVAFNALLKKPMPKGMTDTAFYEMLDSLLADVGLLHVADTKIGGPSVRGLSGGQKRRVTLARGMAAGPHMMFCDEPTSGLSSTDAEACVKAMKLLTKKWGVTILVVIHQPRVEVARLFDALVLLTAMPGRVVYNGPMSEAPDYFEAVGHPVPENSNPADWYLDLITPGAPGAVPDKFREYYLQVQKPKVLEAVAASQATPGKNARALLEEEREMTMQFGAVPAIRTSKYGVPFSKQLRLVFNRKLKLSLIDTEFIGTLIIMQAIMGIFMGIVYIDVGNKEPKGVNQLGFLFIFANMAIMVPAFTMPSIITDREIMKRECSEALYSEWAHIIASSIVTGTLLLIGFVIMCIIMYACAVLPWKGFPATMYWSFLCFICMDALTCCSAAAAKNVEAANACLIPFQMLIGLFNGLTLTKKSAPVFLKWLLYGCPLSLAMEGIAWDIYGDDPVAWKMITEIYGYDEGQPVLGAVICVGIALFGRVLQVLAFKYLNNISK